MSHQKIITAYYFNELSDNAKGRALAHFADINVAFQWWDYTFDDAANIGLAITAFELDRQPWITGELRRPASEVIAAIEASHGPACATYATAQKYKPLINAEPDNDELVNCFRRDLLNCYAEILESEYSHALSDEAIIETIEANEFEFTQDGKVV